MNETTDEQVQGAEYIEFDGESSLGTGQKMFWMSQKRTILFKTELIECR